LTSAAIAEVLNHARDLVSERNGDFASVHLRYHPDPRVMSYGPFARNQKGNFSIFSNVSLGIDEDC
jgi:hypothetical protein